MALAKRILEAEPDDDWEDADIDRALQLLLDD
jgi:hypothetical protein